jgi:hypothetical protein
MAQSGTAAKRGSRQTPQFNGMDCGVTAVTFKLVSLCRIKYSTLLGRSAPKGELQVVKEQAMKETHILL